MFLGRYLGTPLKRVAAAVIATAAALIVLPAHAIPIPLGEVIVNGGFQTSGGVASLSGWTTGGTVNTRNSTNTINTSGGNAGFNDFFASPFALLGDASGAIGGALAAGSSSIGQSFTLPSVIGGERIAYYDLTIAFISAFDGDDSAGPANVKDVFSATLSGIQLFSQDSDPLPDCTPSTACSDLQLVHNPFTGSLTGLGPGLHMLTFTLLEAAGSGVNATNTAAGIDNVSVLAIAHTVPEPAPLALIALAVLGWGWARRTRPI